MKNKKIKKSIFRRKWPIFLVIMLIVLGFLGYFLVSRDTNRDRVNVDARTTSEITSAQPDFNTGSEEDGDKDPDVTATEDQGTASVTDTGGVASSGTSNPRNSNTGEITLYQPLDSILIKSGQEISGTSSLSAVQYRLIDSESGVIATGTLSVLNGKFSGKLTFSTKAKEGRLDIFAIRADANEYSVVEVPLRFSI